METRRIESMNPEPRQRDDYSTRQIEAARRVLVDLGQILASFMDCLVVVGGWTPDLLLPEADEPHVGSIDVDLALDVMKLTEGRYAELLKLLIDTKRYRKGRKEFQLLVDVDLSDGQLPVEVEVEFLAPPDVKLKKNKSKLLSGFRVLKADATGGPSHRTMRARSQRGSGVTSRHLTIEFCLGAGLWPRRNCSVRGDRAVLLPAIHSYNRVRQRLGPNLSASGHRTVAPTRAPGPGPNRHVDCRSNSISRP
jgi:hypothetical protein